MKIEKNVKFEGFYNRNGPYHNGMQKIIESMQAGDSVLFDDKKKLNSFRAASWAFGARVGRKFSSRKVEGGWRVWRME